MTNCIANKADHIAIRYVIEASRSEWNKLLLSQGIEMIAIKSVRRITARDKILPFIKTLFKLF